MTTTVKPNQPLATPLTRMRQSWQETSPSFPHAVLHRDLLQGMKQIAAGMEQRLDISSRKGLR